MEPGSDRGWLPEVSRRGIAGGVAEHKIVRCLSSCAFEEQHLPVPDKWDGLLGEVGGEGADIAGANIQPLGADEFRFGAGTKVPIRIAHGRPGIIHGGPESMIEDVGISPRMWEPV